MFFMKNFIVSIITTALFSATLAQDVHYSMPHMMPLYLNPAMTGFFDGTVRFGAIYRNQWFYQPYGASGAGYQTIGGFADVSLLKEKLKGDYLGIGVSVNYDKAGTVNLTNTNAILNLAYSKSFGRRTKHSIALGLQGELAMRSFGNINGTFSDGIVESFGKQIMNFDAGAGLRYHVVVGDKYNLYAGFAYSHILSPNLSFLNATDKLGSKMTGSFGAQISINDKFNVAPAIVGTYQKSSLFVLPGVSAQYLFHLQNFDDNRFSFGCNFRFSRPVPDAVIPTVKLDIYNISLALAYDITVSEFMRANKSVGAIEVGLQYIIKPAKHSRLDNTSCPKF